MMTYHCCKEFRDFVLGILTLHKLADVHVPLQGDHCDRGRPSFHYTQAWQYVRLCDMISLIYPGMFS